MATSLEILEAYRKLKAIQAEPDDTLRPKGCFAFWGDLLGPHRERRHVRLRDQHAAIRDLVADSQDAQYDLVFSGLVTDEEELYKIIFLGKIMGFAARHNEHMFDYIRRVHERRSELPLNVRRRVEHVCRNWLKI